MRCAVLCLTMLLSASASHGAVMAYDFTGVTNIGGVPRTFTGFFEYETSTPAHTVYFPGDAAPIQQGFQSAYTGGLRSLVIWVSTGESVSGGTGLINVNNIQQAENGAQVPAGESLQAYSSGVSGTVNGQVIRGLYLAFLPQPSSFSWDGLDSYMGGNAESMLQANPALLPTGIDPNLTGTALPADVLQVYQAGVFLGMTHGLSTTVNFITSFQPHVPACDTIDYNHDGLFPDTADIDDFLTVFSGGVCSNGTACGDIDFNNDGLFPDTADIDDFLTVFSGGVCSNGTACGDIDFNNDGLFPDTQDVDALLSVFSGGACLR